MRIARSIFGLLSLGAAVVIAIPLIRILSAIAARQASSPEGMLPRSNTHTEFIMVIGNRSVSGWQLLLVLLGGAATALLLIAFGVYALRSRRTA